MNTKSLPAHFSDSNKSSIAEANLAFYNRMKPKPFATTMSVISSERDSLSSEIENKRILKKVQEAIQKKQHSQEMQHRRNDYQKRRNTKNKKTVSGPPGEISTWQLDKRNKRGYYKEFSSDDYEKTCQVKKSERRKDIQEDRREKFEITRLPSKSMLDLSALSWRERQHMRNLENRLSGGQKMGI